MNQAFTNINYLVKVFPIKQNVFFSKIIPSQLWFVKMSPPGLKDILVNDFRQNSASKIFARIPYATFPASDFNNV